MNGGALFLFRFRVARLWHPTLSRRSQTGRLNWGRMRRLLDRWLPPVFAGPSRSRRAAGLASKHSGLAGPGPG